MALDPKYRWELILHYQRERERVGKWVMIGVVGGFAFGFSITAWGTYSHLPREAQTTICTLITIICGLLGFLYSKKRAKELDEEIDKQKDLIYKSEAEKQKS